jgi:hypothetical protein
LARQAPLVTLIDLLATPPFHLSRFFAVDTLMGIWVDAKRRG